MIVEAVQHIRRMRGGSQGQLMLGSDKCAYVVKFQNNPQHVRVLANEYLASRLARTVGLAVPDVKIIDVSDWLINNTPELVMQLGRGNEQCWSGLQFGSRFAGGLLPGQVIDYMPEHRLPDVKNLSEFAGILSFDKWTGNTDYRQAVFCRCSNQRRYSAVFIDFGNCFNGDGWNFSEAPLHGIFIKNNVYRHIKGWNDFEPWLSQIETISPDVIWKIAYEIPTEWYGNDKVALEILVDRLILRASRVRDKIEMFRRSDRNPFPQWTNFSKYFTSNKHMEISTVVDINV